MKPFSHLSEGRGYACGGDRSAEEGRDAGVAQDVGGQVVAGPVRHRHANVSRCDGGQDVKGCPMNKAETKLLTDTDLCQRLKVLDWIDAVADHNSSQCPLGYVGESDYSPLHETYCEFRALRAEQARRRKVQE